METKPYNLQSPEQIAKDYGGNKQKIAEAMQMGILDPTAGTLAGMFIDRMRSAAQMEAAPQQTVAQQTFAPPAPPAPPAAPAPPAGLGATPEAAAMPPMNAMPPMGATPPMDAAPPQAMAAPQGEMPMMAEGGMVPPYMSGGGLSDLPVPDGMFDEPSNGGFGDGYAGGGMVAFARGDEVEEEDELNQFAAPPSRIGPNGEIIVDATVNKPAAMSYFPTTPDFKTPENIGGYSGNLASNLDRYNEAAPRKTERADQFAKYLDEMMNPETQKARRKEDMWMALAQIGAKMASTPGSLLQAASAGIGEALPGIAANAKERRAEQRAVMKTLVDEERMSNKEITDRADKALDMLAKYGTLQDAMKQRSFQNLWENMGSADRRYVAQVSAAAGVQQQEIGAAASRYGTDKQLIGETLRVNAARTTALGDFLKSPQGLSGITKARKAGISDADYISSLMGAFGGGSGEVLTYDSKGNRTQ